LLKLADVGFVFDATKRRGNHVSEAGGGTPRTSLIPPAVPPVTVVGTTAGTSIPMDSIPPPPAAVAATTAAATDMAVSIPGINMEAPKAVEENNTTMSI
jgi:hypothetical protein